MIPLYEAAYRALSSRPSRLKQRADARYRKEVSKAVKDSVSKLLPVLEALAEAEGDAFGYVNRRGMAKVGRIEQIHESDDWLIEALGDELFEKAAGHRLNGRAPIVTFVQSESGSWFHHMYGLPCESDSNPFPVLSAETYLRRFAL